MIIVTYLINFILFHRMNVIASSTSDISIMTNPLSGNGRTVNISQFPDPNESKNSDVKKYLISILVPVINKQNLWFICSFR